MVGKNLLEHPRFQSFELLLPPRCELDLLNSLKVSNYLGAHKPDMVIHCAGTIGGIQANMKEPLRFLQDNLDMGRNIVQASHKTGLKKLINLQKYEIQKMYSISFSFGSVHSGSLYKK